MGKDPIFSFGVPWKRIGSLMRKFSVIWFSFFLCPFQMELNAHGSEPYFAFEESFALSQRMEKGRYPITTFVPRGYLLYVKNRDDSREISGTRYLAATTQDGVDVFVLESVVTKNTFRETIGSHEIIFNSGNGLCRNPDLVQVFRFTCMQ